MADNRPVVAPLDFDTIKADMIAYFQSRSEFKDYNFTGSGLNLLMDVLAYNTHYNSLAANFLVSEMFLDTAVLRDNVVSTAKLLNYIPRSARSATTKINLSFNRQGRQTTFDVLPAGFQFQARLGSNAIYNFQTTRDYVVQYRNDSENLVVDVYEGSPVTQRFIASQLNDETTFPAFDLLGSNIDTSSIAVSVSGVRYTQVTAGTEGVLNVTASSRVFFVEETTNQQYRILLGNGTIGRRPNPGDEIIVTYLITQGPDANGITNISPSQFVQGFTGNFEVLGATTLGALPETIREIKNNAPHWFQSQYRAVTAADYEIVLRQLYPDIQAINVYGGEEIGEPGKVYISIRPRTTEYLSDAAKQTISRDILAKYNLVTVSPQLIDPDILKIVVKTTVQYDASKLNTSPTVLRTNVYNLLKLFNTEYIGSFLKTFYVSNLADAIRGLDDSVVAVNSRITLRYDVTASDQVLSKFQWSYGNRIYHPFDGYNAANGGVLSTSLFYRVGRANPSGFDDDGFGRIRLFDYINSQKVYVSENAGSINYTTGDISIGQFDPADGAISFNVVPDSFDVLAERNVILEIVPEESVVNVVDYTDTTTLRAVDTSRSA